MEEKAARAAHTLPAPPPGREGWPWTDAPAPPPETMPDGRPWPRVSVVTPSYNQGRFIEQTIRSVLLQGYPNLEYIIMDGGSTDESVEVIRRYEPFLAHWESGRDRGQSHAINKGFERSTGEILCWLNSDDYHAPGALAAAAACLAGGTGNYALVGHCMQVYADGSPPVLGVGRYEGLTRLLEYWKGYQMHQPSMFWRREVFEKVGYLDEAQWYIMDFDYWVRVARHFDFVNLDRVLSYAVYHEAAKTGDGFRKYLEDLRRQSPRYWPSPLSPGYWRLKLSQFKHLDYLPFKRRAKNSLARRLGPLLGGGREAG